MTFIKRDDHWGIRRAVREIFDQHIKRSDFNQQHFSRLNAEEKDLAFNAFFNQFLPEPFKETKAGVIRHREEIRDILRSEAYVVDYVWVRQGNSLKCIQINASAMTRPDLENLSTYEEIEEEKMRWQANPRYDKEQGFSQPIKEEFVQLRFTRK